MASMVQVILDDDGRGTAFDEAMRVARDEHEAKEGGDLQLIIKGNGTKEGNPAIMVTFTCQKGDGPLFRAQAVTTVKAFLAAANIVRANYPWLNALG